MEKVIKLTPKRTPAGGVFYGTNMTSELLCRRALVKLFTLPRTNVPIYITITDKKVPNSYQVRALPRWDCEIHYEGAWHKERLTYNADMFLNSNRLRARDHFYISVSWD